jgi:transketolase
MGLKTFCRTCEFYMIDLAQKAKEIRDKLVTISCRQKINHLGSCLSCVDILVVLYYSILNLSESNRDRFLLGKGHAANTLYAILNDLNIIQKKDLDNIANDGYLLDEHPVFGLADGIECTSGSLGHALSIGLGLALSAKIKKQEFNAFVLMGDGEINEGTVWEAAMLAPIHKLNNLIAIIDYNKLQGTGCSNDIMKLSPLKDKWLAFGWNTYEIDGHNIDELNNIFKKIKTSRNEKPLVIIANTIKGKGVSFMENDNNWHYRIPTEKEVSKARSELYN